VTQLDLLEPRCKEPVRGTQHYEILMYLQDGGRLTVKKALLEMGVYALSQRIGELKQQGWPIKSRDLRVGPRTVVAEYWLER